MAILLEEAFQAFGGERWTVGGSWVSRSQELAWGCGRMLLGHCRSCMGWPGAGGWRGSGLSRQGAELVQGWEGAEGAHGDAARRVLADARVVGQDGGLWEAMLWRLGLLGWACGRLRCRQLVAHCELLGLPQGLLACMQRRIAGLTPRPPLSGCLEAWARLKARLQCPDALGMGSAGAALSSKSSLPLHMTTGDTLGRVVKPQHTRMEHVAA